MKRPWLLALLTLSVGCSGDETEAAPPEPLPTCLEHEFALPDGSCIRPGVPPDGCGEGFVHDGVYGCEPILPAEPCPHGLMAVPGDETCRPVMVCGAGKWADLPVDGTTQYDDASYPGGDGNGSEANPWPTIGQAVTAAAPGALIVVAAGSYSENLYLQGKAVRLWGVCPELVAIEGTGPSIGPCPLATLCIADGADGTEVGGLAIHGGGMGITQSGSQDVLVDRVWVHDNGARGIGLENMLGPTSADVRGSLVEQNYEGGLVLSGSHATVDGSVFRTSLPRASDQKMGRGITVQLLCSESSSGWQCNYAARSTVSVTRSLIEQNHDVGLLACGSDTTVDGSVVRATLPGASDLRTGRGVNVQLACPRSATGEPLCNPATRATGTVTRSLIDHNLEHGLSVMGSDAIFDSSVVRSTSPDAAGDVFGDGIAVFRHGADASAIITNMVVDDNARAGVASFGSVVSVAGTYVRCAAFALNGEHYASGDFEFVDGGGNSCGCPAVGEDCKVVSAGLQPPNPLPLGQ